MGLRRNEALLLVIEAQEWLQAVAENLVRVSAQLWRVKGGGDGRRWCGGV